MYWLDNDSGVVSPPAIPPVQSLVRLYFTEGGGGEQPSWPGGEYFNMLTDEMLNVLTLAGITPDKSDHAQLAKAMQALAFGAYPVGAPIPWPTAVPPAGFLAMTGQSFSAATYPLLAIAYPALVLPDMRAEFVRGWDNGRGIDPGRAILSAQLDEVKAHRHSMKALPNNAGGVISGANQSTRVYSDSGAGGTVVNIDVNYPESYGGSETRPRNRAFNYIVRAA